MNPEKTWKPLVITGAVLLINGLIFLLATIVTQSNALWGPTIGCLVSGFPLLVVGLLQNKNLK